MATAGVEQKNPQVTPEVTKWALSTATARSHCATSWQPAAAATPCTRAITGCGSVAMLYHHAGALAKRSSISAAAAAP